MKLFITGLLFLLSTRARAEMTYVEVHDQQGNVRHFSRLIMGTDHLAQAGWVSEGQAAPTEAHVFEVLDEAVRHGINVIDTSPIYVGSIENTVGKWLKSRKQAVTNDSFYLDKKLNPDRKIYVISKGGFPVDLYYAKELPPGHNAPELKQELIKQKILPPTAGAHQRRLENVPPGTYTSRLFGNVNQIKSRVAEELDHTKSNLEGEITVYLMHRDDFDSVAFNVVPRDQTPIKNIQAALSAPEVQSAFPLLGLSNWTTERINEFVEKSEGDRSAARPVFNSPYFSLFEMGPRTIHARGIQVTHDEMMTADFQRGVFIAPYSPLGGFSIFDKPEPVWQNAKEDARKKYEAGDPYWQNVYYAIFTPENETRYRRIREFTARFNRLNHSAYTVDQMLNAYALAHPRTNFLTVGPITTNQVRRTTDALELSKKLTPRSLDFLYRVKPRALPADCRDLLSI